MKKRWKILLIVGVVVCGMVATIIYVRHRREDPYADMLRELTRIENAIGDEYNKVAEGFSRPQIVYSNADGSKIIFHQFVVVYAEDDLNEEEKDSLAYSLSGIVDPERADESEDCTVNDKNATLYTQGEQKYLCWRYSPNLACILEYTSGTVADSDILRMAESVSEP